MNDYLEIMSKSVFQSGMSWKVIESKWPEIREAFQGFDIQMVANLHEHDIDELTKDRRVVRNYRKLKAIVYNAQKILELDKEHGSFQKYLRSHGSFDATLKAIRKDFKFMGPSGIFVFLYVIGEEVIANAGAIVGETVGTVLSSFGDGVGFSQRGTHADDFYVTFFSTVAEDRGHSQHAIDRSRCSTAVVVRAENDVVALGGDGTGVHIFRGQNNVPVHGVHGILGATQADLDDLGHV